eukprot:4995693-Pyramimonas_sp.AAC.1
MIPQSSLPGAGDAGARFGVCRNRGALDNQMWARPNLHCRVHTLCRRSREPQDLDRARVGPLSHAGSLRARSSCLWQRQRPSGGPPPPCRLPLGVDRGWPRVVGVPQMAED